MTDSPKDEKRYWLDDMRNVDRIWYALIAVCAALFLADALYHKHIVVPIESWFGFYGIYGFVACVFLVLAARALRRVLIRPEDYYDKTDG